MTILENYWTVKEIAALFAGTKGRDRVDATTVQKWISRGVHGVKLPATRACGRCFVRDRDLKVFLETLGLDPGEIDL